MDLVDVNSLFIKSKNGTLFCNLLGDFDSSDTCIIYFAPLFEERLWSQRVSFNFSRSCWEKLKWPVFIVDYYGYGESDGDSENFNLNTVVDDISEVISFLNVKYGISSLCFWGIRTGAFLALYLIEKLSLPCPVMLWAPVYNLKDFMYAQLRSTVASQNVLFKAVVANRETILEELLTTGGCIRQGYELSQIDGFRIGADFWRQVCGNPECDLDSLPDECSCMCLNINPLKKRQPKQEATQVITHSGKRNIHTLHTKSFWLNSLDYSQSVDDLFDASLEWLADLNTH